MAKLKPIRIFWSTLSQRFYASRAWKQVGNHIEITGEKFDVTDDIAGQIFEHQIEFSQISEAPDGAKHIETVFPVDEVTP